MIKAIEWCGDSIRFIDQTKLPTEEVYLKTCDYTVIADAIRKLKIRGAPLIGIAAAYGAALAAVHFREGNLNSFSQQILRAIDELGSTRPTAVNLFWALERMKKVLHNGTDIEQTRKSIIDEAIRIHKEDEEMCRRIGENGAKLIPQTAAILTHCNTGALATGGEGTAQSVITTAHRQGKSIKVYADETRPLLQGARLTTWELMKHGMDVTLITDNMAAFLMQQKKIDIAITGADRIAANGDVANKIGTYNLALIAKHHGVPFYVAAPTSTIDPSIPSGDKIPIEERHKEEVTQGFGKRTAPEGVNVYSPAFDVTPFNLISAIITDQDVYKPPFNFSKLKK
ncbi:MAG: S-methyl-5-thioribose-1-phosphate isomerase [Ignavibacteriales bacterium]|nr:S-methyl-5-thioribose-1-phosphate isomerase [Ignavibacteriales bacterium]